MPSRILSTHWRHGWNPSSLSQLRRTGWKLSFIYFQQKWGKKLTDSVILTRALLSWWKASVGDKTSSKEIKTTTKKTESANSSFVGNFRITHTRPFCNTSRAEAKWTSDLQGTSATNLTPQHGKWHEMGCPNTEGYFWPRWWPYLYLLLAQTWRPLGKTKASSTHSQLRQLTACQA